MLEPAWYYNKFQTVLFVDADQEVDTELQSIRLSNELFSNERTAHDQNSKKLSSRNMRFIINYCSFRKLRYAKDAINRGY